MKKPQATIAMMLFVTGTLFATTAEAETALELGRKYFEWCRAGDTRQLYEAGDFYYRETRCQNDPTTCPTPITTGSQQKVHSEEVGCTKAKCTYRATTSNGSVQPAYEWTVEFYRPEGEFKSCIAATPARRAERSNAGLLFFPLMLLVWVVLSFVLWRLILTLLGGESHRENDENTGPEN